MAIDPQTRDAIVRAARERGIDPAYALAVAQRESNFNPNAKSSTSIRGIYQMTGGLRSKYGIGDSTDPYTQASGWGKFIGDTKKEMSGPLGRTPTDTESYLGHYFGGVRGAKVLKMDPNTPVEDVFTPKEMAGNPNFARAGTIGNLRTSIMADIDKRKVTFGGQIDNVPGQPETTPTNTAAATPDLSTQGGPVGQAEQGPQFGPPTPDQPTYPTIAQDQTNPTPPTQTADSGSSGGFQAAQKTMQSILQASAPKEMISDNPTPQPSQQASMVGNVMPLGPGNAAMPPPIPGAMPQGARSKKSVFDLADSGSIA